jgi:hypothetical protein
MKNLSLPESWDEETEVIVRQFCHHPGKNERLWGQFGDQ